MGSCGMLAYAKPRNASHTHRTGEEWNAVAQRGERLSACDKASRATGTHLCCKKKNSSIPLKNPLARGS